MTVKTPAFVLLALLLLCLPALATNTSSSSNNGLTRSLPPLSDTLTSAAASSSNSASKLAFAPNSSLDSLIGYAKKYLGVRYRLGGQSRSGFDCSGFTSYVFSKFGFKLPPTVPGQVAKGKPVAKSQLRKGDLIFFKGRNLRSRAFGHVGIVVSEAGEKIRFIHASVYRGITIDSIESTYYKPRYLGAIRLMEDRNPLDYFRASFFSLL